MAEISATREGCDLSSLMRRIAETPPEFLDEPRFGAQGRVAVSAVVGDVCRWHGLMPGNLELEALASGSPNTDRNRLRVSLVLCWALADEWFRSIDLKSDDGKSAPLWTLFAVGARELAQHVAVEKFVVDAERREELARYCLARLGFRPRGETEAQAEDRLTSLSAAERARVLEASRQAEARAREVREALARKAAQEAADKYTRE